MVTVGILTISDRSARGERSDESGPALRALVIERLAGAQVTHTAIVPDERAQIVSTLRAWCEAGVQLILTTGGTGFAPRDVTPEAVRDVIEREAHGLVHAILQASLQKTPHAMLSRPVAGMRGRTLIITFPGSPNACRENFETILPALPHGLELLGEVSEAEQRHSAHDSRAATSDW
jgi:molybdenum cofactor synthesis domain-containing protein